MPSRKYRQRTFTSALPIGSRVFVYCRYSGDKQDDRSQRMALEESVAVNGWQLVEWFQDDAKTGSSDSRPGWQALIARSHDSPRPADGVVAWKGDRISRDELDAPYYKADLRRRGYVLHFLKDDIPDGPYARIFESLLEWKAAQDLRDISVNTTRGQQTLTRMEITVDGQVLKGFSAGGFPPRGYRFSAPVRTGTRRNGDPRYNRRYEPDPAYWGRCRRAVELLLAGKTYQEICAETVLFKEAGHLSTWFRCDALYGRRRHGDTTIQDAHERLISETEEPLVRETLARGKAGQARVHPRRAASTYLLSGIICCAYCVEAGREGEMHGHESSSGRWYRCAYRHAGGVCPSTMVRADLLEDLVLDAVLTVLTLDYFRPAFDAVRAVVAEQIAMRAGLVERVDKEISAAERRLKNLVQAIADEYSPTLRDELRQTEELLRHLRVQRTTGPGAAPISDDEARAYLDEVAASIRPGRDAAERRLALRLIVSRVLAWTDHATVDLALGKPVISGYGIAPPAGIVLKPLMVPFPSARLRQAVASYVDELVALRAQGLRFAAIGSRLGISEIRARKVYAAWRQEHAMGGIRPPNVD